MFIYLANLIAMAALGAGSPTNHVSFSSCPTTIRLLERRVVQIGHEVERERLFGRSITMYQQVLNRGVIVTFTATTERGLPVLKIDFSPKRCTGIGDDSMFAEPRLSR